VVVAGEHGADERDTARVAGLMRRCAAAIDRLGLLRARSVWLRSEQIERLELRRATQTAPAAAILLGIGIDRAVRTQVHAATRGLAVVTDHDASAIALAAATVISVNRRGRGIGAARVLIAGAANRAPALSGLLIAAGVGELTLWDAEDGFSFPLSRLVNTADVVINLLGNDRDAGIARVSPDVDIRPAIRPPHMGRGDPVFLAPDPVTDPLLVLPALVQAIGAFPHMAADPGFELASVDMAQACVLELVMATAPDQAVLPPASPRLSVRLAHAAAAALPPQLRHPSAGGPGPNENPAPGAATCPPPEHS
jgi:hypothetical protein